jgi:hypothetical protein
VLSNAQYQALNRKLASGGTQGILRWHHLASGKWISEKNPGYPFFAVVFYAIGLLRLTPLFYGALACVGLYAGARKWLGGWSGTFAVWIFCFSGAAITFAWRGTMPSFTDASLVAAGFGTLLWVMLSPEATPRRRLVAGIAAFLAIEGAVFIRYTDVIELLVAVLAVVALAKASELSWRIVGSWLATVGLFALMVLSFDQWAYGKGTSTGYSAGEITFSLSSFWPNLKGMPKDLTTSMPMWAVAMAAVIWIGARFWRRRSNSLEETRAAVTRDTTLGAVLALGWLGLWLVYLNYSWTVSQVSGGPGGGGGLTVHVIRFYLPAIGLIALLCAWLLTRLARLMSWAVVAALAACAVLSFASMAGGAGGAAGPGGAGPVGQHHAPPGTPPKGSKPPNGAPSGPGGVPAGVPPSGSTSAG